MTQLVVTGLHKAFGDHPVLTGLDLEVPAGSLTAILGPSGSGKTTLLRVLAGFERGDAGTVTIGGSVVDGPDAHLAPQRRQIGYVPQEGSLFPHLTVAANVGFGLPPRQRKGPAIAELLDAVGLAGLGKRYPHELSGGQQQRVALARALAPRPNVILLDEPFSSLDAGLRASLRFDVMRILREQRATTVFVTHDQQEALSVADLAGVINGGPIRTSPGSLGRRTSSPAPLRPTRSTPRSDSCPWWTETLRPLGRPSCLSARSRSGSSRTTASHVNQGRPRGECSTASTTATTALSSSVPRTRSVRCGYGARAALRSRSATRSSCPRKVT